MFRVQEAVAALRESKRAAYLFETKIAAEAVGLGDNKFSEWWLRTREKLKALAMVQPGQLSAEFMSVFVDAEIEREEIESKQRLKRSA